MATVYEKTDNYGLNLYGDNDPADLRDGYNGSMRTIDTTLKTHLNRIEAVESRETHDEAVVKALIGDNTVDKASFKQTKWDNASTDATAANSKADANAANLTALGADTAGHAAAAKTKWDKASSDATDCVRSLTALGAETTAKAGALKNTIDTNTSDIAEVKTDYATKQYVNSTFLKHANVAVAKANNMQFTVAANAATPKTIVFNEHDATTSFDDEDGVITLSTDRESMTVSKDGVYLVSADMRVGAITFTNDDSYRGIELLVYVNDSIMATAPASMVVGANGAIRGAQYAAFPCRPYKLTSGDKVALKIRSNDRTKEISGTINYAVLSVFRISK